MTSNPTAAQDRLEQQGKVVILNREPPGAAFEDG
jgi:hypothetical protein